MGNFKKSILTLFFLLAIIPIEEVQAQRKNSQYAFERVVYQRWNRFRPWWWFKIVYRKYDDEDRRNVLQLAPIMATTAITRDYADNQKKSIDTLFRQKVNVAVDRVLQKRWIMFDEERVLERYGYIDTIITELMEEGWGTADILKIENLFFMQREKIQIVEDSYIGDAEKSEAINTYLKDLDDFIKVLNTLKRLPVSEFEITEP
ncbi:hypothetical protein [Maribacter polysaccharolyticus]|uniref:hypothetical protein n=1 Tax=Maribacter polysaccharolyticus TaxID=3020831 RepID=UPI00237F61E4|nr:hypothetical protein [Maribacter polysaccharolyticus]MDE3744040.1 hypothetical protein [Maribacter polysaccharolyticus]